jgi:hypothetical protein
MATNIRPAISVFTIVALTMACLAAGGSVRGLIPEAAIRFDVDQVALVTLATAPGSTATLAPQARPSPKPKPTPKPTPRPTPTPAPTPKPTPRPTAPPTPRPTVYATPRPTPRPTPKRTQTSAPTTAPAGAGVVAPSIETTLVGSATSSPSSEPFGWVVGVVLGLVLVTGLGLVVVALRRRRTPTALDAAGMTAAAAAQTSQPPIAARSPDVAPHLPTPSGDENIPRWRRPSVAAARFGNGNTSAIRTAMADSTIRTRPARVFAESTEVLGERMVVRYGVPLLSRPDEAFGRAREHLTSGDQVEILDRGEIWANVITPSGAAGWVPSATLGPVSGERVTSDEDPAQALEPRGAAQHVAPPSLEMLLEAARRAREEAAREEAARAPTSTPPEETAARTTEPTPAASDGRRPRDRRRPKVRSTTRRT